jgi:hypothetical protein
VTYPVFYRVYSTVLDVRFLLLLLHFVTFSCFSYVRSVYSLFTKALPSFLIVLLVQFFVCCLLNCTLFAFSSFFLYSYSLIYLFAPSLCHSSIFLLRLCFTDFRFCFLLYPSYHINNIKDTGCPRVPKKLHNLFVIKYINFFIFLDDSYASTAYSKNIAVYIQGVPIL